MELRQLIQVILRRWWIIAIPTVVALAAGIYSFATTPVVGSFSTAIRFTAAAPPEDGVTYEDESYYPWLASEFVVNALTDWVRTSSFANEVSLRLADEGLEIAPGAIQASIAADNVRSVMTVFINWGNPDELMQIAEAVIAVLQNDSALYFPQLNADEVDVVPLDSPSVGPVPPALTTRLDPFIRIALGAIAGLGLAFLVEYLDPTIRGRRDIERLGLSILAEVPRKRGV
ncbi:MAG: hypothetical protein GYB68_08825 [Chloroflexi bacterium]|nr:hypothetical protein [Chloroflexota bacterium]